MIVSGHGRIGAGNRGGGGGVHPLQPRDRPAGDGRQGGAAGGAPARGLGMGAAQARALDAGHRPVDPRLAAAGGGAVAGAARGGAAGARRRAARAAAVRRAHARRARGSRGAPGDARDRHRRDRRGAVRAGAQRQPAGRATDDRARPDRPRRREPAAVSAARARALGRGADDGLRRPRVRLERRRHQAGRRRPVRAPSGRGSAVGPVHGGRIGGRGAQRDQCAAGAPGDPGGARGVRDSDDRAGGTRAGAVRRALRCDAARRRATDRVAGRADRGSGAAGALTAAADPDGR